MYICRFDMVMEVVSDSPKDRHRDLVTKRDEYAQAGIAEYWIVDPLERKIAVLTFSGDNYAVHGEFGADQTATSQLLHGFAIDASSVWALENQDPGR